MNKAKKYKIVLSWSSIRLLSSRFFEGDVYDDASLLKQTITNYYNKKLITIFIRRELPLGLSFVSAIMYKCFRQYFNFHCIFYSKDLQLFPQHLYSRNDYAKLWFSSLTFAKQQFIEISYRCS